MRIIVLGATGGTGRQFVTAALAAGHKITAVVRDPGRVPDPDRVDVVTADVMDPAALEPHVAGHDAVVSALGPRRGDTRPVCTPGAESAIAAMRATGVRRLVVVTASGHIRDRHDDALTRWLAKPIVARILRTQFADFTTADAAVRASGLDWTIMRPSRLTDGPAKPYRTAVDRTLPRGYLTGRTDLARATLAALEDPATIGHAIAVAY